ncbi:hypothetical protein NQ318_009591 [Aromia moschata]|uniref:NADH dehydrogenase [ubiquinone] iron-sulfur protein 4, mitochondrial n=1 Tax=Aromia moschata TaxID=1265417 RepID=A0AAV8X5B4_9CUCU|nr:hypothetical protein NQ318_009591 [Aromia moschata]
MEKGFQKADSHNLPSEDVVMYFKLSDAGKKKDLAPKTLETEDDARIKRLKESKLPFKGNSDITLINGVPKEYGRPRTAKIFKPPKNPMQSGTANIHHWEVTFDPKERWENPLMGWSSTGDSLSNMKLKFCTKKEAIAFCERNGWEWFVQEKRLKKKFKVKTTTIFLKSGDLKFEKSWRLFEN